ncbi:hypothetical protein F443_15580 [Phytophthora nicotianae P1569]|uniref:Uncharacterized protein n=1 Tax=Phytophthora nicotianae P1569 TaxID=1317065 RepID=V9EHS6_PHYNI|nr:hypothetical protein F443_15580 [Phytophthora nicotianae P1569]
MLGAMAGVKDYPPWPEILPGVVSATLHQHEHLRIGKWVCTMSSPVRGRCSLNRSGVRPDRLPSRTQSSANSDRRCSPAPLVLLVTSRHAAVHSLLPVPPSVPSVHFVQFVTGACRRKLQRLSSSSSSSSSSCVSDTLSFRQGQSRRSLALVPTSVCVLQRRLQNHLRSPLQVPE